MSSEDEEVVTGNARKRRRLNPQFEPSSEQLDEPASSDSPQSLHDEPGSRQEQQQPQKPKYRIHIVQNTDIAEDEFFSQAPTATDDPHRIRGAFWVKPKPAPPQRQSPPPQARILPSPPPRPTSRHIEPPPRPLQTVPTRQLVPARANPPVERSPPRDVIDLDLDLDEEPDDHEAALMEELADFPSDDFQSPGRSQTDGDAAYAQELADQDLLEAQRPTRMAAPQNNMRQTTLFGAAIRDDGTATQASQTNRVRNWPAANREEPPTHHKLDSEALETAVYPTNLGTIRDYQYNIVLRGLYSNLLVALPTGLGKTFIAATIMLNWYRWTKDAQIVFVAPTRPLVAQQVDACFHIAGIPRSATTLLTGQTAPGLRAEEWESKRVFFMTPQTIINDLKTGICDPKRIVLVVVDEAHRATGNYAYVEVVKFLRRFNTSFRVLALTATPGSTVESVQEVIDGLGIARTEIRTEESLDIRQYVHQRNIETMLFDFSDEMLQIMEMLSEAIKPVQAKLNSMNAYWGKDPMTLTAYGCTVARQKWMNSPAGRNANWGLKSMVNNIFNVLAGLAHAIELLKFHGIGPFYRKVQHPSNSDKKENKYERQIREHESFQRMLVRLSAWCGHPDFVGHPKLEHLSAVVLNHFMDRGEGTDPESGAAPSATRVMIFAHFRDSAEEIARVLTRHGPMVRPHVFVGQASTNGSEGMDQKKQQEIIGKFKRGTYNTLVATSIGEEGLDIGEVDLIVCYDASASPIRMLQRMGRTGRKRAGNISVLLMKQKEQDNFEKAKDNYEKMQQMIAVGDRFQYHLEQSPRIVPKGTDPVVEKRVVEIPIENSQAELPEPKKKKGKQPKRPPKKFHMPDGVMTGFMKASEMDGGSRPRGKKPPRARSPTPDPVPDVSSVVLTDSQNADLESRFLYISGEQSEVVEYPALGKFPALQRRRRPMKLVDHGRATTEMVAMLKRMHRMDAAAVERYQRNLQPEDQELADKALSGQAAVDLDPPTSNAADNVDVVSASESETETEPTPQPARKRKAATKTTPAAKKPRVTKDTSATKATTKKAAVPKKPAPAKKAAASKKQRKKRTPPPPDPTQPPTSSMDNGINIMNTDDDNDPDEDDDDDGSDLLDFIDDEPQAEAVPLSSADSLLALPKRSKKPDRRRREQTIQSDSVNNKENESLADLDEILGLAPAAETAKARRGGRRMVVDSDDEEE